MLIARHLFYALLLLERPRTICDIGSCDAFQAFRFRRMCPGARVVAFEANPDNYAAIRSDPRSSRIEVRHEAVTDHDGETTFYVVDVPAGEEYWAKGASSLNRRSPEIGWEHLERPVAVPACRLDTVLRDAPPPIALWVDVEGAASSVVEGLAGIADRVSFISIELENRPLWHGQAPASEVLNKLGTFGFRETLGRDWSDGRSAQVDVLVTRDVGPVLLRGAKALAAAGQLPRVATAGLRARQRRLPPVG